jgi:hypothetical protein
MLLIDKKWPKAKENSLMKDAEKLSSLKEKCVKETINHLLF